MRATVAQWISADGKRAGLAWTDSEDMSTYIREARQAAGMDWPVEPHLPQDGDHPGVAGQTSEPTGRWSPQRAECGIRDPANFGGSPTEAATRSESEGHMS
jgi:hypothetical protein